MVDYVRKQTLPELLSGAAQLYSRNITAVILAYVLPAAPLAVVATLSQRKDLLALCTILNVAIGALATGALTLIISDVSVGRKPSFRSAFAAMFGRKAVAVIAAGFLVTIIVVAGFLLVIPGLILVSALLIVTPVVVLEGRGPLTAIRRSWLLSRGVRFRNFALFVIATATYFAIGLGLGLVVTTFNLTGALPQKVFSFGFAMFQLLLVSFMLVATVLVYYDARVRHEGYDQSALSEDLRR